MERCAKLGDLYAIENEQLADDAVTSKKRARW